MLKWRHLPARLSNGLPSAVFCGATLAASTSAFSAFDENLLHPQIATETRGWSVYRSQGHGFLAAAALVLRHFYVRNLGGNVGALCGTASIARLAHKAFNALGSWQDRDAAFAFCAREQPLLFSDESIPFEESLGTALENELDQTKHAPLKRGRVTFTDALFPPNHYPTANLAALSCLDFDVGARNKKRSKRIDPTTVTFPLKPGDYASTQRTVLRTYRHCASRSRR